MDKIIAARLAAAEAREPEQLTPEEAASLAAETATDDGSRIDINAQIAKTSKYKPDPKKWEDDCKTRKAAK